jgi:2-haloacid dehalogenase
MNLTEFHVLSFDCYGTLIDWETGIMEALQPLIERSGRILSRDHVLQAYARIESDQEQTESFLPYREVLQRVYVRLAQEWHAQPGPGEALAFSESIRNWPAFVDSAAALQYLKKFYKLVILSNVDRDSFEASNQKLQVEFDYIFTSQEIGSYKPDLRNFQYMIDRLAEHGLPKRSILHLAVGLFHDHLPANQMGLATGWIHRRAGREGHGATHPPKRMPTLDFRFTSLARLVKAHQDALKI